ncbi:hypothetical protein PYL56_08830 [Staphylococcus succinus]|uniref:hypothetical protein n=1 Tax=Staphylococcus succinus TaxID=61015 RepID=UPI002481209F|nr:hypothetical protein [Staphylococcus succinus]MDH9161475.1 hypothetical protein [Staphylococcus succinus]
MIKTLLMYSTLTVSAFVTGWVTGDFIYSILVPIVVTAVAYHLYDYFIENGIKKDLCDNRSLGVKCTPNEYTQN